MALVRMSGSTNTTDNRFIENSICLPKKWSVESGLDCYNDPTGLTPCLEYAMIGGWGPGNYTAVPNSLKMGYWAVINERFSLDPNQTFHSSLFDLNRVSDQYICSVSIFAS